MKNIARTLIMAFPFLFGAGAFAQQQTFTVSPANSSVGFALTGTGHEVHGTFHVTSGTIQFDRSAPKMSGNVVVSAMSGESGDNGRDKTMHQKVLEAERFADVTFQPQNYTGSIAATGDSTIQVSGTFTLHGTPHDLTVPMQIHIDGQNLTAKGSFVVPYVKWGLKDPSVFILKVAKEVHIDLNLVGTVSPAS
ncbi:YceI family protein [Occallatibacter savannae]|uniref:YceI family protein n=1 Tax=Occallatibacter savannae TaxID=1002691 RepID=UPI001EF4F009|nr:YceI family protein [Occallatibacter savannae]